MRPRSTSRAAASAISPSKQARPAGVGRLYSVPAASAETSTPRALVRRIEPPIAMRARIPAMYQLITVDPAAAPADMLRTARPLATRAGSRIRRAYRVRSAPRELLGGAQRRQRACWSDDVLIIIGRGGGSIEDLRAFNDEALVSRRCCCFRCAHCQRGWPRNRFPYCSVILLPT